MNKHEWLVRASSIGDLMTKGRSKSEEWGETAIKSIRQAMLFNKYGIEHNFTSKYTEKGIANEREGLIMANEQFQWGIDVDAPKQRLVNSWVIGEPDLNQGSILADIKNSWSADTFPFFDTEIKNKSYIYQLQTYMWLSGQEEAHLVYTLTNAGENLIANEVQRLTYRLLERDENFHKSINEVEEIAEKQVRAQLIFDHIPVEKRIKRFTIKRDDALIEEIKQRIEAARVMYNVFYNQI